jgi:hypothetical protein
MDYEVKLFRRQAAHYLRDLADQMEAGEVAHANVLLNPSPQGPNLIATLLTSDGHAHDVRMDIGGSRTFRRDKEDTHAGYPGRGEQLELETDGVRVPMNGTRADHT